MSNRYRIYTEDINREMILSLADDRLSGYTVYCGTGVWEKMRENSLIIEVIGSRAALWESVRRLSEAIKAENHQQAVLVTVEHDIETHLL